MYLDFSAFQDDGIVNAKTPEEAQKKIQEAQIEMQNNPENVAIFSELFLNLLYGTNYVTPKGRFYCHPRHLRF